MATFDFQSMADTADELIEEFGQKATLIKSGDEIVDPTKPWEVSESLVETRVSIVCVKLPVTSSRGDRGDMDQVSLGDAITFRDRAFLLVRPEELVKAGKYPETGDRIILADSSEWMVSSNTVVDPDGVVDVLFKCIIGR